MKLCPACGQGLNPQDRFCSRCGAVQLAQPGAGQFPIHTPDFLDRVQRQGENVSRRLWPLWAAFVLFATGVFIAGLFYFLSNSEPAKMTVQIAKTSPAVRQALGEIQDVGWANGGISTRSGGSGTANFTVSVKGSMAKGKFYAYFVK
ncbi:MAG TPA: cytochrome c oxidase assembly factor Coa1 family protein, partial [bacterium]|nr:cytochrome c oxidase assembly factor Coa1 family protein [bacterium]